MTLSSSLSSPGIGSGLDVKSIVDQLVAVERRPIDVLARQVSSVKSRISSFSLVKNFLSNLHDAAARLGDPDLWRSVTASSSDDAVASVASSSAGAAPGRHSVKVVDLAQPQTAASHPFADAKAAIGPGRLTFQAGTWSADGATFTPAAGASPTTVDVPASASLESVRDRINQSSADVRATIVRDAGGARLVLRSAQPGDSHGFTVDVQGPDGQTPPSAALQAFQLTPGHRTMDVTEAAQDAHVTIDGVAVVFASNTLDSVIDGLTITLHKPSATAVTLGVQTDSGTMKKALSDFVGAYNDLARYLAAQTKYDASTKTAAPLQGDATTMQIQRTLRNALQAPSSGSSVFGRLLDVGIHLTDGNALTLDASVADTALKNPEELSRAFTTDIAGHDDQEGFGVRFSKLVDQAIGYDGAVTQRTQALSAQVQRQQKRQEQMEDRLTAFRARLLKQYTALDGTMSELQAQSSYVTQQMKMLANQATSKK